MASNIPHPDNSANALPKIEAIVRIFHAQRVAPGRYRARCPGHNGHSLSSLSIREGERGCILIHCFAGCEPADVLKAVNLGWKDLFSGPSPTPAQIRAIAEAHQIDDLWRERLHNLHGDGCERLHQLQDFADGIAARLMQMRNDPEADALAAEFHKALDDKRRLEVILIRMERAWF